MNGIQLHPIIKIHHSSSGTHALCGIAISSKVETYRHNKAFREIASIASLHGALCRDCLDCLEASDRQLELDWFGGKKDSKNV